MTSIMNYPTYFPLRRFLNTTSATSTDLVNSIDYTKRVCKDATLLGSFSKNHDNRRFPCDNSDMAMAKNLTWGLVLSLVNCGVTLVLMCFLLPPGLLDGALTGGALILILSGWLQRQPIFDQAEVGCVPS